MAMASEIELPNPLTDDEIKDGIAYKVAGAVRESLDKTCHLYGKSYPKFRAEVKIHYVLDDFGRTIEGNVRATVQDGEPVGEGVDIDLEIPETPPNKFRKETEQDVPVLSTQRGRQVENRISYAPKRGPGRRKKVAQ